MSSIILEGLESTNPQIQVYLSETRDRFTALVCYRDGSQVSIDSDHIKCGIKGAFSHQDFIQKIDQLAREKFAVFAYSSVGQATEVWIFEATKLAAPLIKKAKEKIKQSNPQEALKYLETALKIQEQQGDITELNSVILQLRKELFLRDIKRDADLYLSPEETNKFNDIIKLYQNEEDPITYLSEYIQAVEMVHPHHHYLAALVHEYKGDFIAAVPHYLYLTEKHSNPLSCLKKAAELVKTASDPFAFAHFLEKLDRDWLIQLSEKTQDPELERWVLLKDAIRMTFEECLAQLSQVSLQTKAPTCFICFNVEEVDVGKWLEHTLVPDLDRIGIKPIFCFRDLGPGKELNNFQGLIRGADQVILICTPKLKRKCDERKKAPTGVAQEVRLAKERYNDPDKYETIFPLYLKGDRKTSCPSEFFEPILGTHFTFLQKSTESSVFSYYASAFELFGGMRQITREFSRKMKETFLAKVTQILRGEINQDELESWREARLSKNETILKSIEERISQKIQMVNLPNTPLDFTGRKQVLETLHEACRHKHYVALTGLGGIGKTALAIKYGNDYKSHYQFIHFIPAGITQLAVDGLLKLADDLHVPKSEKTEERLQWLKTTLNRFEEKYLLIFDGLDQIEVFEEIAKYFPERGGCILLTTRMPEQSKIRGFELIELKSFSLEEAMNYLLLATGCKEKEAAAELAEKLGRLPLALVHAGRYIDSQKISIQKYIKDFNRYELEIFKDKYLTLTKGEKTILTTWKISIDAIEKIHQCPLGKEVLEMFAFLNQAPIPRDLIESWFKISHHLMSELELGNALKYLYSYSMINSLSSNTYNIHSLVQGVLKYQIVQGNEKDKERELLDQILSALTLILSKYDPIQPGAKELDYFSHAESVADQARQEKVKPLQVAKCYEQIGQYLYEQGQYSKALKKHQEALELRTQAKSTLEKASSLRFLGDTLVRLGKYSEAYKNYEESLDLQKKNGKECLEMSFNLNGLGKVLVREGKPEEARKKHKEALEIQTKLHADDRAIAATLYFMGIALANKGDLAEAERVHLEALERRKKSKNKREESDSLYYLGNVRFKGKDYQAAQKYHQQALDIRRELYREVPNPYVAASLSYLSKINYKIKEYHKALDQQNEALSIREKLYENQPNREVATSYYEKSKILYRQEKYSEADQALEASLKINRDLDHSKGSTGTAACLYSLGNVLLAQKKYQEAYVKYQEALEIQNKTDLYREIIQTLYKLGKALDNQNRPEEAQVKYEEALALAKTHLNEQNSLTQKIKTSCKKY